MLRRGWGRDRRGFGKGRSGSDLARSNLRPRAEGLDPAERRARLKPGKWRQARHGRIAAALTRTLLSD